MIAKSKPSDRHVFKGVDGVHNSLHYKCQRCGHRWSPSLDFSASSICTPSVEWLKDHPNDGGRTK